MVTLVTGATGLVGNNVARLLLSRGEKVRVLARSTSDRQALSGLTVELVEGDIRDDEQVRRACEGVTSIVHSAAWVHIGWRGLDTARAVNVEGTRRVAKAAQSVGARLVHVSSVDAIGLRSKENPSDESVAPSGKPLCPYVVTKIEAEDAVRELVQQGLNAVIVNPGFMLGPWDWKPSSGRMLLAVAQRWTPIAPTGGCSICDVRDVANGILCARDRGQVGQRYILAGTNLRYIELWRQIARGTGARPPLIPAGPLMRMIGGAYGDIVGKLTGREPDVNSAAIKMSSIYHYYSSARAKSELGYTNRSLDQTIHDTWQWFKQHGKA